MLEYTPKLDQLEPKLREVIESAAAECHLTVVVVETMRDPIRQKKLKAAGASRTLKSRHLKQKDGYAHAVDIGFRIGGEVRFDWPLYYIFAHYVRDQARAHAVKVTWGAIWDTPLNDIKGDLHEAHDHYVARFRRQFGRSPLADGPHFQT